MKCNSPLVQMLLNFLAIGAGLLFLAVFSVEPLIEYPHPCYDDLFEEYMGQIRGQIRDVERCTELCLAKQQRLYEEDNVIYQVKPHLEQNGDCLCCVGINLKAEYHVGPSFDLQIGIAFLCAVAVMRWCCTLGEDGRPIEWLECLCASLHPMLWMVVWRRWVIVSTLAVSFCAYRRYWRCLLLICGAAVLLEAHVCGVVALVTSIVLACIVSLK